MDNEEIRKLLQELKETSDGSTAVRSKVVKIHVDTPAEAERRMRAKKKAEEEAARKRLEAEAKAQAEEEERQRAAEKAAREAVEAAKEEARSGFAEDLDETLLTEEEALEDTEDAFGEEDDLDLNWEYDRPTSLKSGLVREDAFGPEPSRKKHDSARDEDQDMARDKEGDQEDLEDFDSEDAEESERESITGLPGMFGRLSDGAISFVRNIKDSMKRDLSKSADRQDDWESSDKDWDEEEQSSDSGRSRDSGQKPAFGKSAAPDRSSGSEGPRDSEPDEEFRDFDDVESRTAGFGNKTRKTAGFDNERGRTAGFGDERGRTAGFDDEESGAPDFDDEEGGASDFDDEEDSNLSPDEKQDGASKTESGKRSSMDPDEEWKRRMEEAPRRKSFAERMKLRLSGFKSSAEKRPKKEKGRKASGKDKMKESGQMEDEPSSDSSQSRESGIERDDFSSDSAPPREPGIEPVEDYDGPVVGPADPGPEILTEPAGREAFSGSSAGYDESRSASGSAEYFESRGATGSAGYDESRETSGSAAFSDDARNGESLRQAGDGEISDEETDGDSRKKGGENVKHIEVINLNENQNNKDAEVIPLIGKTGPLPDAAEMNAFRKKIKLKNKKDRKNRKIQAAAFAAKHKKEILAGVIALAAIILIAVIVSVVMSGMKNKRESSITGDEGLTVKILSQPDSYTGEGDVQMRITAPETIQSVTVNGEHVAINQGTTVEFTYHAMGGSLDVMVVSTDKVRSAKVVLAYVDSAAPTITITEADGKISLNAEDPESGVDKLYIGSSEGLSDIPLYEEYSGPLDVDPDKVISYYATDLAGNSSDPVVTALTPAESIAFERDTYGLFPGAAKEIKLITTPEHAFVNNLSLEAENTKVVTIESGRILKGLAEGDTTITATADGVSGVTAKVSVAQTRSATISAVGDCTLGTDVNFSQNTSFDAYYSLYGSTYFFEKVRDILNSDDSTFANFEGTLTTSDQRANKTYAFKGDPSYTDILKDGSIDVVTLANNHSSDYGDSSLTDTKHALEDAGIRWCEGDHIAYQDLNGILTAYIGIYSLDNGVTKLDQVKNTIAAAKDAGADLIIVEFHWGNELVAQVDEYQTQLAHAAVDAGANLVLGSHAHILMGIEKYNGVYIVYGLGNFCFGGNTNPTSDDTMIWRQTFTFTADGLQADDNIAIIPCQVSSDPSINNYQPVPVTGEAAQTIMQTIDQLSEPYGQTYSQYMVDGTQWGNEMTA